LSARAAAALLRRFRLYCFSLASHTHFQLYTPRYTVPHISHIPHLNPSSIQISAHDYDTHVYHSHFASASWPPRIGPNTHATLRSVGCCLAPLAAMPRYPGLSPTHGASATVARLVLSLRCACPDTILRARTINVREGETWKGMKGLHKREGTVPCPRPEPSYCPIRFVSLLYLLLVIRQRCRCRLVKDACM